MDRQVIIQKFEDIKLWKRGGKRAYHKPLLVLYAIGRFLLNKNRLIPYTEVDKDLGKLLQEFGSRQTKQGTHYSFWRLQKDSVWEVTNADQITPNSSGDARKGDLLAHNVSGGFHETIAAQFQSDSTLVFEVIQNLLAKHFPPSIHSEILQAVDIELPPQISETGKRISDFRKNILKAYEYKCAVCGFDVKLGTSPIALEASHIKWKSHGGPNEEANGLALCILHHKLFDLGAFTLSKQLQILVSDDAHGTKGFKEWLMDFHGQTINLPQRPSYYPADEFINWHVRDVFTGDYREL